MNNIKIKTTATATTMVLMLLVVCCIPVLNVDAADINDPDEINIVKGQTWEYTPTFPSGLSPTLTVATSTSSQPSSSATFSATSGYAQASSGKIVLTVPSDSAYATYYLTIKAATTNPAQIAYTYAQFNIKDVLTITGVTSKIGVVGDTFSWTPTTNIVSAGLTSSGYTLTGTLPSGLTFNSSTGAISGTPTASKAVTSYTVTANTSAPVQSKSATVSIVVYSDLNAGADVTVNGIVGGSSTYTAPTKASDLTVVWAVTSGSLPTGLTLNTSTGAITGTYSAASNTYSKQVTLTATTAQGTQSDSRIVTFNYENAATITGTTVLYGVAGTANTDGITLSSNLGTHAKWSITSNGGCTGATISSAGKITLSSACTAGTYTMTVKAVSDTVTTNAVTKTVTVTVENSLTITVPTYVYSAVGGAQDSAVITSNLNDVSYVITGYDGLASSKISINNDTGAITITASSGDNTSSPYTISVKAVSNITGQESAVKTFDVIVTQQLIYNNSPSAGYIVQG